MIGSGEEGRRQLRGGDRAARQRPGRGHTFRILESIADKTIVQHVDSAGRVFATRNRIVYVRENGAWRTLGRFPLWTLRDSFGLCRLTARAARADKCNIYVNRAGSVLGIRGGKVYRFAGGGPEGLAPIQGDSVMHRGICEDKDGFTYFGEYFMNPAREPVRIWRVSPGLEVVEKAYEFASRSIRHVHGIYRDPFHPQALWVTVGDYENECYIYRSDDGFRTIERLGDGSQTWRVVNLFFTRDHVCWLTDSNLVPNHACRMSRSEGKLEVGHGIDCSAWYGTTTVEGLHLSFTTVERGPAIKRRESAILVSEDAFRWTEVKSFRKDPWRPLRLFKYGVISCPSGEMSCSNLYISGEGLVGFDGSSLRVAIEPEGKTPW